MATAKKKSTKKSTKKLNIKIKMIGDLIDVTGSSKDSWNPAEISDDMKAISYIRKLADSWNTAQLNEALKYLGFKTVDTWNAAELEETKNKLVKYFLPTEATGNPITLNAYGNLPYEVSKAEVTFLPKQDLHGYDSPWVGGAGKNKLQNTATTTTVNGVTFTVNSDGSVRADGTANENGYFIINSSITLKAGTYAINGCPSGGSGNSYYLYFYNSASSDFGNGSTATFDSETTITNTRIVFSSGQVFSNKVFYPMIRLASVSDATFEPYENICPIMGRNSVKLMRCGKNIVNEVHHGNMNSNGSYGTGNTRVTNATSATSSVIKVKAGKYTISAVGLDYATVLTKDNYDNIVDNFAGSWHTLPYTFTITQTANLYFTARKSDNTSITLSDVSVQIEEGETATTYEPYQGETYTETLGATYYGGKVDFVSGEGSEEWDYIASYDGETLPGEWISDRDAYAPGTTPTTGAEVAYKLSEAVELTLTPQEIELLKGKNVIWTDGDDILIEYKALLNS